MDQNEIEELLIEVTTGKKIFENESGSDIFAVSFPSISDRDKARIIYTKTHRRLSSEGVPTAQKMRSNIQKFELLPRDFYQQIALIEASIKSNDDAIEQTTSNSQKYELKFENEGLYKKLNALKRQEDTFLDNTVEAKSEDARLNYFVSRCIFCGDELDEKYWDTYKDFKKSRDAKFVRTARLNFMVMALGISAEKVRELARNNEWRSRWKTSKNTGTSIFEGSIASWDKNKTAICYWSDFYDSVYSCPTPPPEVIVNDDEKLFDWIREVNRRNSSKSKSDNVEGDVKHVDTPYKIRPKKPVNQFRKIG